MLLDTLAFLWILCAFIVLMVLIRVAFKDRNQNPPIEKDYFTDE